MEIISADNLQPVLQETDVVIIDARGGADALERYNAEHLKGAFFVDLETDLSQKSDNPAHGGRHPLPEPNTFGLLLTRLGISPLTTVIVYDDKNGANAAARFWWMLKAIGHKKVFVVSGGLNSLILAGFEISNELEKPVAATDHYIIENWQLPIVTADEVAEAASDKNAVVIDVRENYRYIGQSEPIDLVAGHIPGALNIPYTSNLNENGEFLSADQLAEKYRVLGKGRNIIVHCGSGVTACHTLLALSEAGIADASLYVGSWSEWSRNDRPVATGENDTI